MSPGGAALSAVTVTNIGAQSWTADGPGALQLSYHWMDSSGTVVVQDGLRTLLPAPVPHAKTVSVQLGIFAPDAPGDYVLTCDAVIENVGWLSNLGSATLKEPVRVLPTARQTGHGITVIKAASRVEAVSAGGSIRLAPMAVLLGVPLGFALLVGGWYVASLWRRV
jgi:hypothetical protein